MFTIAKVGSICHFETGKRASNLRNKQYFKLNFDTARLVKAFPQAPKFSVFHHINLLSQIGLTRRILWTKRLSQVSIYDCTWKE